MTETLKAKLLNGVWAMPASDANRWMSIIAPKAFGDVIESENEIERRERKNAESRQMNVHRLTSDRKSISEVNDQDDLGVSNVVTHYIKGPVMKEDECGIPGMLSIGNAILNADYNPDIVAQVIWMDTPGGSVDGTPELANIIYNAKKPIVIYVNGYCCSAGAWITSGATHVMASSEVATFGSIGVMATIFDQRDMWADWGIKEIVMRGSNSKDKNEPYYQALEGNVEPYEKLVLNPIEKIFHDTMRNRMKVDESAIGGRTMLAVEAIELGLCNDIGTYEEAVMTAFRKAGKI